MVVAAGRVDADAAVACAPLGLGLTLVAFGAGAMTLLSGLNDLQVPGRIGVLRLRNMCRRSRLLLAGIAVNAPNLDGGLGDPLTRPTMAVGGAAVVLWACQELGCCATSACAANLMNVFGAP